MKLVALLAWYDERPQWLQECVVSLRRIGVDHLVALDGAYGLFPGGRHQSHPSQAVALSDACATVGIALTLEQPDQVWSTEMEKRTRLFRLGETVSTEQDWFLVVDADEVTLHHFDLKAKLAALQEDAAECQYFEPTRQGSTKSFNRRCLFRAYRGIEVGPNHYTYTVGDRRLWGRFPCDPVEAPVIELAWEHRTFLRELPRLQRAKAYYRRRDELAVEAGWCEEPVDGAPCGARAFTEIPTDWDLKGVDEDTGRVVLTSAWMSVCRDHEPAVRARNNKVLKDKYGLDPATVQVTFEKAGAA